MPSLWWDKNNQGLSLHVKGTQINGYQKQRTEVFHKKKVFLKISQNPRTYNFIKKETPAHVFPVNFAKIFSTLF